MAKKKKKSRLELTIESIPKVGSTYFWEDSECFVKLDFVDVEYRSAGDQDPPIDCCVLIEDDGVQEYHVWPLRKFMGLVNDGVFALVQKVDPKTKELSLV